MKSARLLFVVLLLVVSPVLADESNSIYFSGRLRTRQENGQPQDVEGIFVVNPETGVWRRLLDKGRFARSSPDGVSLVYSDANRIWTCDSREAGSPGKVSDLNGSTTWSGDGKSLYVTERIGKEGDPKYATWQISLDGLTKSRLRVPEHDGIVDASRDGQWILTSSMRSPRTPQLFLMRPDATVERRVNVDGIALFARFSPDSRRIAYLRDYPEGREIHVVNVDGTGDRTILSHNGTTNAISPGWTWSPDGKQFAVVRFDWTVDNLGKKRMAQAKDLSWRIEIVNVDGTDGRPLKLKDVELIQIIDGLNWR